MFGLLLTNFPDMEVKGKMLKQKGNGGNVSMYEYIINEALEMLIVLKMISSVSYLPLPI